MSITAETRREAYGAVLPKMTAREQAVLEILQAQGAMSAEQIMRELGTQNPNTVRPRITALRDKGLIAPIGKRINAYGRHEAVWAIKKTALEADTSKAAQGNWNIITPLL